MKNSLRVTFRFSFKGVNYEPSCVVDLDAYMINKQTFPKLDLLVAKENAIDTDSYLFEVMQQSDIEFLDATGLANEFCKDNVFDVAGFEEKWREQKLVSDLQIIADELGVKNLNKNTQLKNALLKAYRLGSKN